MGDRNDEDVTAAWNIDMTGCGLGGYDLALWKCYITFCADAYNKMLSTTQSVSGNGENTTNARQVWAGQAEPAFIDYSTVSGRTTFTAATHL